MIGVHAEDAECSPAFTNTDIGDCVLGLLSNDFSKCHALSGS